MTTSIENHTNEQKLSDLDNRNLYIKGLWKGCNQIELDDLFRKFGVISQSRVYKNGTALVRYQHGDQAKAAIDKMDGAKLDRSNVKLSVKYAYKTQNFQDIKHNKNNIYLRCLPPGLKKGQLTGLCKEFGDVSCARLVPGSDVAFVRYRKAADAQNAIRHLNGIRFENHNEPLFAKLANCDPFQRKTKSNIEFSYKHLQIPFIPPDLIYQRTPTSDEAERSSSPSSVDKSTQQQQSQYLNKNNKSHAAHKQNGACNGQQKSAVVEKENENENENENEIEKKVQWVMSLNGGVCSQYEDILRKALQNNASPAQESKLKEVDHSGNLQGDAKAKQGTHYQGYNTHHVPPAQNQYPHRYPQNNPSPLVPPPHYDFNHNYLNPIPSTAYPRVGVATNQYQSQTRTVPYGPGYILYGQNANMIQHTLATNNNTSRLQSICESKQSTQQYIQQQQSIVVNAPNKSSSKSKNLNQKTVNSQYYHNVSKDYANKLYAQIKEWYPNQAGKLAGMFLKGHDEERVKKYLVRPERLRKKIDVYFNFLSNPSITDK